MLGHTKLHKGIVNSPQFITPLAHPLVTEIIPWKIPLEIQVCYNWLCSLETPNVFRCFEDKAQGVLHKMIERKLRMGNMTMHIGWNKVSL